MHYPNSATITSDPIPAPGMAATEVWYSDRKACTITRVSKSGKTFWMKRDIAKRIDNFGRSETQEYEFLADPTATEIKVTKGRGSYMNCWKTYGGQKVWVGVRDHHHDYSF